MATFLYRLGRPAFRRRGSVALSGDVENADGRETERVDAGTQIVLPGVVRQRVVGGVPLGLARCRTVTPSR
jgi:hypothetical protein